MTWFYDLPNLLICIFAIIVVCKMKIIPTWVGLVFSIYCFIPYLLNDFLFPARYMKDQFYYFNTLQEVRSFNFLPHQDPNILITSWFLSILPLPYVETIKSLGFFNRFMFFLLFCWLYSKKFLTGIPMLFLLFYPSLILYTSLSLRDPLILSLMLAGVIFLIDQKYIKFICVTSPLYFLKFQNFYFMIILFLVSTFFKNKNSYKRFRNFTIIVSMIFIFVFFKEIFFKLDLLRAAMFIENGGNINNYETLYKFSNLLISTISAFPYFLIKPLPWEAENLFQIIQSIENIFLLIFLFFFTKKAYQQDKFITNKWLIYSIFVMSIYGLVVFNFGTAVRYKFVIICVYVIGLAYELYKVKNFKFEVMSK